MSIKIQNTPNRAAFDVQASQDLRETMRKDPKAGLKAAAQQFETMFLQMVMKSMRDTVPDDGLLSSDQTRFYNGLLDQQMAQNMATSGKGVGFAQLIEKQLGASLG
ncbi:MAG: rod-binding protein, partial [Azonexus sp.]|nr:rod-binding protein [Azonexus sp.]